MEREDYLSLPYRIVYGYIYDSLDHVKYHVCAYLRHIPCLWAEGKDGLEARDNLEQVFADYVDDCIASGVEPLLPPVDTSPSLEQER